MIGAGIDLTPRRSDVEARGLAALVQELRVALLDQATNDKLTALAHRRRCMKLRNKIAAFYGQE